jgi:hypothetical protein
MVRHENKEMKLFVSTWPEAKTKLLEKYFEEGCSTSLISHRLGEEGYRATKNSVIGKLHRLGLAGNRKPTKDKPAPQRIKKVTISTVPMEERIAPKLRHKLIVPHINGAKYGEDLMTSPLDPKPVALIQTDETHCRALIDYRRGYPAYCCGKPTIWKIVNGKRTRSSWCQEHHQKFTQPDRHR